MVVLLQLGDYIGFAGLLLMLLNRIKSFLGLLDKSQGGGTANTAMVAHAQKLLALNEGDMPYAVRGVGERRGEGGEGRGKEGKARGRRGREGKGGEARGRRGRQGEGGEGKGKEGKAGGRRGRQGEGGEGRGKEGKARGRRGRRGRQGKARGRRGRQGEGGEGRGKEGKARGREGKGGERRGGEGGWTEGTLGLSRHGNSSMQQMWETCDMRCAAVCRLGGRSLGKHGLKP